MDAPSNRIPDHYRQHLAGLGLSDEEALTIIRTIRAIAANVIDDMFEELTAHQVGKSRHHRIGTDREK